MRAPCDRVVAGCALMLLQDHSGCWRRCVQLWFHQLYAWRACSAEAVGRVPACSGGTRTDERGQDDVWPVTVARLNVTLMNTDAASPPRASSWWIPAFLPGWLRNVTTKDAALFGAPAYSLEQRCNFRGFVTLTPELFIGYIDIHHPIVYMHRAGCESRFNRFNQLTLI